MPTRDLDWTHLPRVTASQARALLSFYRAVGPVFGPRAPWRQVLEQTGIEEVVLAWAKVASLVEGLEETRRLAARWKVLRGDGAGAYVAANLPLVSGLCALALGEPPVPPAARRATVQETAVSGAVLAKLVHTATEGRWTLVSAEEAQERERAWGNVVWSIGLQVRVGGLWGRALVVLPTSVGPGTGVWPRPEPTWPGPGDTGGSGPSDTIPEDPDSSEPENPPAEGAEPGPPRAGGGEDASRVAALESRAPSWVGSAESLPVELAVGFGPLALSLAEAASLEAGGGLVLPGDWLAERRVRLFQPGVWWDCQWAGEGPATGISRLEILGGPFMERQRANGNSDTGQGNRVLDAVSVEASVEVGRVRLSAADVLSLGPGAVLTLDRPVGSDAELWVGGTLVARGRLVDVEGQLGFQVTERVV